MNKLYWVLFVVILIKGCKKEDNIDFNNKDSIIKLRVLAEQGNNIVPIYDDTISSIGLPGAIANSEIKQDLPFLVLGKGLREGEEYMCQYIGALYILTEKRERFYGVALPTKDENKTMEVESYKDLTQSQPMMKIWLKEYFTFAYNSEVIREIKWENEIRILRAINR